MRWISPAHWRPRCRLTTAPIRPCAPAPASSPNTCSRPRASRWRPGRSIGHCWHEKRSETACSGGLCLPGGTHGCQPVTIRSWRGSSPHPEPGCGLRTGTLQLQKHLISIAFPLTPRRIDLILPRLAHCELVTTAQENHAIRRPMRAPPPVQKDGPRVNEEIRNREVQLIDQTGHNHGTVDTRFALEKAQEAGLDLVEIAPNSVPPVCKILDFGKYKYQAQKKAAEARKKQKVVEVKEIKLRPMIDDHDYDVKMRSM